MNVLEKLGKAMNIMKNIMNFVKFLGKHQGRRKMFRVSLDLLAERLNIQWFLSKRGMLREKERRRRFNLLRSLLPRDRGLRKMIPQYIEKGH